MAVNKKNYNKNIKVSESTVAQLRKGTKASNIAKANAPGASAEFREAVRRFYGASTTKAMPMVGGKTIKTGPRRETPTMTRHAVPGNKTKSGKTSTGLNFGEAPKSGMNIGKSNLTPAQRQAIAARQSKTDKAITAVAQMAIPGTGALKGVKVATNIAKYGKFAARNLASVKRGVRLGEATKGELKDAQKLADAIAKRKQQLKNAPKSAPAKPAPKSAPVKKAPAKKAPTKKAPAKSVPAKESAAEMSKKTLDRIAGKRPNRRLIGVTAVGYGAKERIKMAKDK